jgi:POT family proton-dependent oligopeptide transporter
VVLIFGSVVFFTLFEQAGSSLNLFADRNVDLAVTGRGLTFGPFLFATPAQLAAAAARPADLDRHGHHRGSDPVVQRGLHPDLRADLRGHVGEPRPQRARPEPVMKFGLALIQVGLGFLVSSGASTPAS